MGIFALIFSNFSDEEATSSAPKVQALPYTGELSSSGDLHSPLQPPSLHPTTRVAMEKGGQPSVTSDGISMVEANQIDSEFISIANLSHSDIRVCYKNECRIFFLALSFVGKLTIYDSDYGYSPNVTAEKRSDGIL